ncbi:hypothetical protein SNE40_013868 [Patella caerulea]|uniref:Uncharacterized protein n=1 Tax=Patella caerulea TaxID=87958 RepID=A0AAN8JCF8_PATCE
MSESTDGGDLSISDVLGKSNLRSSYTTLTYISDDVTSPEYVSPDFNDSYDNSSMDMEDEASARKEVVNDSPPKIAAPEIHANTGNNSDNGVPKIEVSSSTNVAVNADHVTIPIVVQNNTQNGVHSNGHAQNDLAIASQTASNGHPSYHNVQVVQSNRYDSNQTPLTKRRITLLKVFSICAAIFFFPAGIPAAYYAFKIDKAFQDGIIQGNIDLAFKFAKKSEKLIILSIVLGVLSMVILFAIIERVLVGNEYYWHSGTIVGH